MDFSGFDWDQGNRAKCRKHGVSTEAIEALFRGGVTILPDEAHSQIERRFKAIGRTDEGRMIFAVFTFRRREGALLIRPISARYMHKKEIAHYEKSTKS
ncbi:MAG TPA: BrnT family toxin [Rhizomicrobium sp.]|jgi:uncharacterized DUF497 family protein|nr:BrnT family toxin [Rhizomicrobium sp.]